jgi:hypothetical protein
MNPNRFHAELTYQISLSIAEGMLQSGLLTTKEFSQTKDLLLQKYNPPIGVLFAAST